MSYPQPSDYGREGDRALVPGSLTVFRHFQVDLGRGVVAPMNWSPSSAAHRPYDIPGPDTLHKAVCRSARGYRWQPTGGVTHTPPHDAPQVDCSCGFYASYSPDTDFYPSQRWGKVYADLTGCPEYGDIVIVRGVAEVSGTVVMGSRGVRAGKLKIVALAVDWEKHVKPADMWQGTSQAYVESADGSYKLLDNVNLQLRNDANDDAKIAAGVWDVAARYGAEFHTSVREMYDAHPMADLSALGVAVEPPNARSFWDDHYVWSTVQQVQKSAYAQLAAQVMPSFQQVADTAKAALKDIAAAYSIPDEFLPGSDGKPGADVFRRVMLAKKARPAPPGTGIDRRKRKL
ncbi:hypothetical protein [Streptomyces sp. S1]|uniref:hypothetical protein n=1 Tax=Streptomyces sp. S1 TaxID=718288 RepID=UPI003D761E35